MRNFFYFISEQKYLICDPELCAKSEHTFDMPFSDLANNKVLLGKLNLFYIEGMANNHTMEHFANYLSAFYQDSIDDRREKMLTNPTIRLMVEDEKLLEQVKKILA
jgi:hypothetical protein